MAAVLAFGAMTSTTAHAATAGSTSQAAASKTRKVMDFGTK